ncbi:hypothetical protein Apa02nite_006260 [Actinoplanes palleronii]|uniref:Transposase n=1 Tax=Actinoplanes palleronii TaxID=113570 RepID=A0ABQ4B1H4_9ACTN|nr:hypothetical protein Apa02nite_006260 [Actinoplanes palleronii]
MLLPGRKLRLVLTVSLPKEVEVGAEAGRSDPGNPLWLLRAVRRLVRFFHPKGYGVKVPP